MTELSSKTRKHLRGLGQTIEPSVDVGKAGITQAVIDRLKAVLATRELVKVHMPPGSGDDRRRMGEQLALAAGAACVGVVGRMAVLYRPNPDLPPGKRLVLPGCD